MYADNIRNQTEFYEWLHGLACLREDAPPGDVAPTGRLYDKIVLVEEFEANNQLSHLRARAKVWHGMAQAIRELFELYEVPDRSLVMFSTAYPSEEILEVPGHPDSRFLRIAATLSIGTL